MHNVEALLPNRGTALHAAELSGEQSIEPIEVILRPANARTAHEAGEALLVDPDGILDQIKVDVGDLKDIERQVTLEDACSVGALA